MDGPTHRSIETNGIRLRAAIQGDGPLAALPRLPGDLAFLATPDAGARSAGYRAVASDLRGYGESARPDASDAYT
jgi:pimeloyl-ACP methyl ester carboxylesterase